MKYFFLVLIFICSFSCEKLKLSDIRGFNGRVIIKISDLGMPNHKINIPIVFEFKQSLQFENIVNKNKKIKFKKNEIEIFNLGLEIIDTTGNILKPDIDYIISQKGFPFSGDRVYPQWEESNEIFKADFKITFLNEGIYIIRSTEPKLEIKRDNFLLREKRLTLDFDISSRQKFLSKYFKLLLSDVDLTLGDDVNLDKNSGIQGYFFVKIEK
jgi:hypothetical protein